MAKQPVKVYQIKVLDFQATQTNSEKRRYYSKLDWPHFFHSGKVRQLNQKRGEKKRESDYSLYMIYQWLFQYCDYRTQSFELGCDALKSEIKSWLCVTSNRFDLDAKLDILQSAGLIEYRVRAAMVDSNGAPALEQDLNGSRVISRGDIDHFEVNPIQSSQLNGASSAPGLRKTPPLEQAETQSMLKIDPYNREEDRKEDHHQREIEDEDWTDGCESVGELMIDSKVIDPLLSELHKYFPDWATPELEKWLSNQLKDFTIPIDQINDLWIGTCKSVKKYDPKRVTYLQRAFQSRLDDEAAKFSKLLKNAIRDANGRYVHSKDFDPAKCFSIPFEELNLDCMARRLKMDGLLDEFSFPILSRLQEPRLQHYVMEFIAQGPEYLEYFAEVVAAIAAWNNECQLL